MNVQGLVHSIVAVAIIAGYVVLTSLGHDGNALLGILGGQALGGAVSKLPNGSKP